MALRTPELPCPSLSEIENDGLQWHRIECQLATPLYGGGVESATVDVKMPIRVASIRGQLRFWWRLLAKHKWKLGSDETIRQAEFALWGGMGKEAHASEVFLKVSDIKQTEVVSYKDYAFKPNPNRPDRPFPTELAYVFFPADNETNQDVSHHVIKEGLMWYLNFRFGQKTSETQQQQVIETLHWWGQFGGLGFRSRRGTGSVQALSCDTYPEITQPLNEQEIQAASCQLATSGQGSQSPMDAWKKAVAKMRDFRQAPNLGRNPKTAGSPSPAGRSRWPEPDAIRRLQKREHKDHQPKHPAGNIFPRGLFGMPIIFHFKDRDDPKEAQLKPKGKERMPSPVLIRPIKDAQGKWRPAALLLPYEHIGQIQVELTGSQQDIALWDEKLAVHVKPIHENAATHPLLAFMNYFKK